MNRKYCLAKIAGFSIPKDIFGRQSKNSATLKELAKKDSRINKRLRFYLRHSRKPAHKTSQNFFVPSASDHTYSAQFPPARLYTVC